MSHSDKDHAPTTCTGDEASAGRGRSQPHGEKAGLVDQNNTARLVDDFALPFD